MRLASKKHLKVRLDSEGPVRKIKSGMRGIRGRVATQGDRSVAHESMLERDWYVTLDFDRRVKHFVEQPFTIEYRVDGRLRKYTPDVKVEYSDGGRSWTVVYEIKYRDELVANWLDNRARFKAAIAHCRARGWRFKLLTEVQIRGQQLENIRFLRRYRDLEPQPLHSEQLFQALKVLGPTTPKALLAAAWSEEEQQSAALPELWRLVAAGEVCVQLDLPVTMACLVWI